MSGPRLRRRRQILVLSLAPQIAEADRFSRRVVSLAYQRRDCCSNLDTDRVAWSGEDARVGVAVWGRLARPVLVAVERIDPDYVERLQVPFPHSCKGQSVQPGVVGDEADDALAGLFGDAPLGHAEEPDIEVVEALSFGPPHLFGLAVGLRKPTLLIHPPCPRSRCMVDCRGSPEPASPASPSPRGHALPPIPGREAASVRSAPNQSERW